MRGGPGRPRGGDADEGSVTPLILVCLLIAVGLVIVAAAATSLHLERMRLLSLADGASVAAAESFDVADARVEGDRVVPRLTDGGVQAAAGQYLAGAPTADLAGFALVSASAPGGTSAAVTVAAVWRPPILSSLVPVSLPVQATSTAAARFG